MNLKTRKKVELPSGATCVVRAMSLFDWTELNNGPQAFPSPGELAALKDGSGNLSPAQVEAQAAMMRVMVLKCCSPLTTPEGDRFRVVEGKDLDQLGDDEISVEELNQADAIAIVNAASEVSQFTKEAGESAGNFPKGSALSDQAA